MISQFFVAFLENMNFKGATSWLIFCSKPRLSVSKLIKKFRWDLQKCFDQLELRCIKGQKISKAIYGIINSPKNEQKLK